MIIFDWEFLTKDVVKKIIEKGELDVVFESSPKDRGIAVGKDLQYIEVYGEPRRNYKKYDEFQTMKRKIQDICLEISKERENR